jgi:sulfhydrogenase subunit delta
MTTLHQPTLAVWKFASCDGCQLTLLDCEDELLALAGEVRIEHFLEATSAIGPGPYDLSLVEGSVTTPADIDRIRHVREVSGTLVAIGACATAGGIQALRNFADVDEFRSIVYARPDYIETLDQSTPISAHVPVDFQLPGCPIDKGQLLEVLVATLHGRPPNVPAHSVCHECKARGTTCVMVADGTPCLGPVTRAGCGALCPAVGRGCYGCFGPMESPNAPALAERLGELGMGDDDVTRVFRTFNAAAFDPLIMSTAGGTDSPSLRGYGDAQEGTDDDASQ